MENQPETYKWLQLINLPPEKELTAVGPRISVPAVPTADKPPAHDLCSSVTPEAHFSDTENGPEDVKRR